MSQHHSAVPAVHAVRSPRRAVRSLGAAFTAAAAIALGAIALGPASPALAHDQLVNSEVVEKADGTAEAVRLSFSNNVIEVGTEFVLTAPDGSDAKGGDPTVTGPDVTQPIAAGLKAGDYAGAWRVVSSDGHPIDGAFTLVMAADGSAVLKEEVATEEHDHADNEAEHSHEADDHEHAADDHEADHDHESADHDHEASAEASDGSGLGTGAIIGLSGAGVVIVALAIVLLVRRRSGATGAADTQSTTTDTNTNATGSNDTPGGSN